VLHFRLEVFSALDKFCLDLVGLGNALDADQLFAFLETNNAHTLRVAAQLGHFGGARAHHGALIGNQHQFIAVEYLHGARQTAVALADLHGDNAHGAAALGREVAGIGAFAIAVFADRQHLAALLRDDQGNQFLIDRQTDAAYAARSASHRPHFLLAKAHGLVGTAEQHHFALAIGN